MLGYKDRKKSGFCSECKENQSPCIILIKKNMETSTSILVKMLLSSSYNLFMKQGVCYAVISSLIMLSKVISSWFHLGQLKTVLSSPFCTMLEELRLVSLISFANFSPV